MTANEWIEIDLKGHSTTLVLGKNGAGKSTMLDAISFALFKKPFRKGKKMTLPRLINSITKKGMLVEVEFSTGGHSFMVRRGQKPVIFEVYKDGELVDQSAVRDYQAYLISLIGMSHRTFTQIVVLGSAKHEPFMDLEAKDRRVVVEEMLDLEIFSAMNVIVKDWIKTNKEELSQAQRAVDIAHAKLDTFDRQQQSVKIDNAKIIAEKKKQIVSYANEAIKTTGVIKKRKTELETLVYDADEAANLIKQKQKITNEIYANEQTANRLRKESSFFHDNTICPTCKQDIDAGFSATEIHDKDSQIEELQRHNKIYSTKVSEITERQAAIAKISSRANEVRNEIQRLNIEINSTKRLVTSLQEDIQRLQEPVEEKARGDRKPLEDELTAATEIAEKIRNQGKVYQVASQMLQDDGIKSRVIKQYVPVMNQLINQHLTAMDFFIDFQIDENFDEKILSRYRDDFVYESFSEGQKRRIDLAILFTWRAIAKLRNSVSTNLLVMDEILDGSMDEDGISEFLRIINNLTDKSNVIIMSHRGEVLADKFSKVLTFSKVGNFTQMKEGV
jgi:DNA repair exonuclease SbcCD ATPase subunit